MQSNLNTTPSHKSFSGVCRCKARRVVSKCYASLNKAPVVLLPGFLQGSSEYEGMAKQLEMMGHPVAVAPIQAWQWWPTLLGGDFKFYLQSSRQAILKHSHDHAGHPLVLVGHSAGGWLARLLLGDAPYLGQSWNVQGQVHVSKLITLGTPHLSIEAYPFGRVQEQRQGEPLHLPEDVKGSSLRFTNYYSPTAQSLPGVKIVCVVGTGIQGASSPSTHKTQQAKPGLNGVEVLAPNVAGMEAHEVSQLDAWIAGTSYAANSGSTEVDGDGVCPVSVALLPGAQCILLQGVWHTASHRPWYGDPEAVQLWARYLQDQE